MEKEKYPKYIIRAEFDQFLTSLPMRNSIILQKRSGNGYGFWRPGLKTGGENGIFWSEIGSGFGEPGGTPLPRIPRSAPPPPGSTYIFKRDRYNFLTTIYLLSRVDIYSLCWGTFYVWALWIVFVISRFCSIHFTVTLAGLENNYHSFYRGLRY